MGLAVTDAQRRQILRGDLRLRRLPVRPPWALEEARFSATCTRCNDCVVACQEDLISAGDGGYPGIDFHAGACTFCGTCAEACSAGALRSKQHIPGNAWSLRVTVNAQCLAVNAVVCRTSASSAARVPSIFNWRSVGGPNPTSITTFAPAAAAVWAHARCRHYR